MIILSWSDKRAQEMLADADKTIVARRNQYEEGLITISDLVNGTIDSLADLHHYCATKDNEDRMREICAEICSRMMAEKKK